MISSYLKRQRAINGSIAGLLLLTGLGLVGYGAYTITDAMGKSPEIQQVMKSELKQSCIRGFSRVGMSAIAGDNGRVTVQWYDLEDPRGLVAKASTAIQQCVGFDLEAFCMGDGCKESKMTIKMSPAGGGA